MAPDTDSFTLSDLCDLAAVTPRTVRYYVAQGLLRSPAGAGPGARYDAGHLARLRLIRRLQREHLPLAEIRRRLAALTDTEAVAFAEQAPPAPADSALSYVRAALSSRGVAPAAVRSTPPPLMGRPPAPAAPPAPAMAPLPELSSHDREVAEEPVPYAEMPAASNAALDVASDATPDRSQWERIALAPDIELHVRRPLSRPQSRAVDRLIGAARQILKEDLP